MAWTTHTSPRGRLTLVGGTTSLRYVYFPGRAPSLAPSDPDPSALTKAVSQLEQYFAGERQAFELEGIGGRYFENCNEAATVDHRDANGTGVAAYALDPANAHRLWDISEAPLNRA